MKVVNSKPCTASQESFGLRLRTLARNAEHEQYFYARMLQQYFRPGISWLDAGCGHSLLPGWLHGAQEIERQFLAEAGRIVGADVDAKSLAAPSPICRVACDLGALAFESGTFDLITCNMVVEHLAEPTKVFREFFRVLKSGGLAILLTPNLYHWANILSMCTPFSFHRWVLKSFWNRETDDVFPTRYRCNTRNALRTKLLAAGFSDIRIHSIPGRPRLIDLGPLFYPEWMCYRISLRFPSLREILCGIAWKCSPLQAADSQACRAPEKDAVTPTEAMT